jgi:D-alanyl-D-alanine carboxypeptidase
VRHRFAALASSILFSSRSLAAGFLAVAIALSTHAASAADSRYAAIVVDAKTGKVLYSSSAESRRYPASLTKMMTLYITFEALAAGKITKQTKIPFSAQASAKPPTKLGVKAGGSVTVDAVLAVTVRTVHAPVLSGDSSTAWPTATGSSERRSAVVPSEAASSSTALPASTCVA